MLASLVSHFNVINISITLFAPRHVLLSSLPLSFLQRAILRSISLRPVITSAQTVSKMLFSRTVIASALLSAGAVFAESSDIPTSSGIKSTIYRTTSILRTTKVSATTTLTSTLPIATSSSLSSSNVSNTTSSSLSSSTNVSNTTVSVGAMDYAEAALPTYANTFPISVITISTCVPTVIYSVVTVTPTESPVSATPSVGSAISYSLNAT